MQIYKQITEATTVHRRQNDCSINFGKLPGNQPWWSTILVQLQALQFY